MESFWRRKRIEQMRIEEAEEMANLQAIIPVNTEIQPVPLEIDGCDRQWLESQHILW